MPVNLASSARSQENHFQAYGNATQDDCNLDGSMGEDLVSLLSPGLQQTLTGLQGLPDFQVSIAFFFSPTCQYDRSGLIFFAKHTQLAARVAETENIVTNTEGPVPAESISAGESSEDQFSKAWDVVSLGLDFYTEEEVNNAWRIINP